MEQVINQHEERFLLAFSNLDAETLEKLIHDKLLYNNPLGEVLSKEDDMKIIKSGNIIIEEVRCLERKVQVFEDTAVVSTIIYLKGEIMGHGINGKSRFLRTWKKFDDGWKIIGAANVSLM